MSSVPQYSSLSSSNGSSMGDVALATANEYTATTLDTGEPRKIVVLGVPWQTEDVNLERHFGQFGDVLEAQIMRERYTGKSRGFGFITFANAADAQKAIAADHLIDGRRCEAKFALPEGKVGSARTTRIFVARIPSSVTDFQFRAYFEQFGVVQDAYMPKDPSKQGHRGIGFVTYASADSVERVMQSTHILNGNEIAIDRATPKEKVSPLPGRLSMSQPNLHFPSPGSSAHGGHHFQAFMSTQAASGSYHHPSQHYQVMGAVSPSRIPENYVHSGGMIGRQMSHPVLASSSSFQVDGSPPAGVGNSNNNMNGFASMGGGSNNSGANLNLLAQAQAQVQAALQHQVNLSSGSLNNSSHGSTAAAAAAAVGNRPTHGGRDHSGTSPNNRLLNLLNANAAAMAAGGAGGSNHGAHHAQLLQNLANSNSMGHLPGSGDGGNNSTVSSSNDLRGLLAQQHAELNAGSSWGGGGAGNSEMNSFVQIPRSPSNTAIGGNGSASGPRSARAGPRIFVGKLSKETTEQDVKNYFTRFGYVMDVYLPRDKNNKKEHRGFGFVTFETEASIQRVVSHGPHQVKNSIVAIDAAVPRQDEVVFKMDSTTMNTGMSPPSPKTEALAAFEVMSLEGSAHGNNEVAGVVAAAAGTSPY